MHSRALTKLPHHLVVADLQDPSYSEDFRLRKAAKVAQPFHYKIETRILKGVPSEFCNNRQTIKVGDVVLVHNEGPRLDWRLAIVEELIVGGDGLIRAANVRTSSGNTNRLIVKLYPLGVNSSSEVISQQSFHLPDGRPTQPTQLESDSTADVVAYCCLTCTSAMKANFAFLQSLFPRLILKIFFSI